MSKHKKTGDDVTGSSVSACVAKRSSRLRLKLAGAGLLSLAMLGATLSMISFSHQAHAAPFGGPLWEIYPVASVEGPSVVNLPEQANNATIRAYMYIDTNETSAPYKTDYTTDRFINNQPGTPAWSLNEFSIPAVGGVPATEPDWTSVGFSHVYTDHNGVNHNYALTSYGNGVSASCDNFMTKPPISLAPATCFYTGVGNCPRTNWPAYKTELPAGTVGACNAGQEGKSIQETGTLQEYDSSGNALPPVQYNYKPGDLVCQYVAAALFSSTNPDTIAANQQRRISEPACVRVGSVTTPLAEQTPFFKVLGGDTAAGAGFMDGTSCSLNNSGGIKSWNNDNASGGGYAGAGSQMAALALGQIKSYASALLGGSGATAPSSLTFANTNPTAPVTINSAAGQYGGGLHDLPCMDDFAAAAGNGTVLTTSSVDPASLGTAHTATTYTSDHSITITGDTIPADGRQVTIVVTGASVYISPGMSNGITYGDYSGGILNIPQLRLIVKGGNIYIDPAVKVLHGMYASQGGTVYTCADSGFHELTSYSQCGTNKLTFYGALAADHINFDRSYGSLAPVGGVPVDAAETIQFTPELWLAATNTPQTVPGYDIISALPPIL